MDTNIMAAPDPPKKLKSAIYPEPLIIPPILSHRQTFIVLHGRGSNAQTFGPPLLSTQLPDSRTFQAAFPHAKFIFPTASKRRAKIFKRSMIHQWFDYWSLPAPTEREDLMLDGLLETSQYIHGLLTEAIKEVGAEKVVLGGLSQGCAAVLVALLTWDGEPLAAVFGFCGWLPLRSHLVDIMESQPLSDEGDVVFGQSDNKKQALDLPAEAVAWLTEEIDLPVASLSPASKTSLAPNVVRQPSFSKDLPVQMTPIFLAHGTEDEKVPIRLGYEAKDCLVMMKASVNWREYEGLGHWYSGQMMGNLGAFLGEKTDWVGS